MPLGLDAMGAFARTFEAYFAAAASMHGISILQCRPYGRDAFSD